VLNQEHQFFSTLSFVLYISQTANNKWNNCWVVLFLL